MCSPGGFFKRWQIGWVVACLMIFSSIGGRQGIEDLEDWPRRTKRAEEETTFDERVKGAEVQKGLFTLYRRKDHLYLEIQPSQLEKNFIMILTLEKGLGIRDLLGGLPIDEYVLTFRRMEDKVLWIKRNPYFRAAKGTPVERAVEHAFSDSILTTLPIEAEHPKTGALLIDIQKYLLSDIPALSFALQQALGEEYSLNKDASHLSYLKVFPENIEFGVLYNYVTSKPNYIEGLPDARSVELGVRYSVSELRETDYRPRLADDRVGYFLVALKDFSSDNPRSPFVRYIIRWNLQKADPTATISPPKKPIVFWVENTVPVEYREAVREGILMWNKAFEKAGFRDAIVAKIQPDDADWDAADVRYNTIRWITSSDVSFGGIGPARVNPLTGEILDADILIENETVRGIRQYYRRIIAPRSSTFPAFPFQPSFNFCEFGSVLQTEASFALLAMTARGDLPPEDVPPEFVHAYIRELVGHEVGHVLGLRHNFKGSLLHKLEDVNRPELTRQTGLSSSIMDYIPVNLAPKDMPQGEYFTSTVGPWDVWMIEYGYKPIDARTPEEELVELRKIASLTVLPEHAYGTDEDTFGWSEEPVTPDPTSNWSDLSDDPIAWAERRIQIAQEVLPRLIDRSIPEGEGYELLRQNFHTLLMMIRNNTQVFAKFIGGQYMRRMHKGDGEGLLPMEVVPAKEQRRALELLNRYLFLDTFFQFPPELLNRLSPSRWAHWGSDTFSSARLDYPLHEVILEMRAAALRRLLHPYVLSRIQEGEKKMLQGKEAYSLAELFDFLRAAIWSELSQKPPAGGYSEQSPFISSFRREFQKEFIHQFIDLMLAPAEGTPEDARTLAWATLTHLQNEIREVLSSDVGKGLDLLSRTHLEETKVRIQRALEARFLVRADSL